MSERASTKGRDRPILFSPPMVRALLAGTKTQTRRILKPRGRVSLFDGSWSDSYVLDPGNQSWRDQEVPIKLGDRLWVRETWAHYQTVNHVRRAHGGAFSEVSDGLAGHRADGHDTIEDFREHIRLMSGCDLEAVEIDGDKWRPSIFMPRWASRLTLTVTDVRVQRLQDISEEDARAEGVEQLRSGRFYCGEDEEGEITSKAAITAYAWLWNDINGDDAWMANPWVAAYTFTVERRNIDEGLGQRADATPTNPLSEGRERS